MLIEKWLLKITNFTPEIQYFWKYSSWAIHNHVHNILRIFMVEQVSFHHKWNEAWLLVINLYKRVASRVPEWFKT